MSNSHWPGPTRPSRPMGPMGPGPQPPYGPPQGLVPPPIHQPWTQPPYLAPHPGPGQPFHGPPHGFPEPPRNGVNPLVIALIVGVVLAVGAGGFHLLVRPSEQTTSDSRSTLQPDPSPTPMSTPTPSIPDLPEFPRSFGDFTLTEDSAGNAGALSTQYVDSNDTTLFVTYLPFPDDYDSLIEQLENPETFGDTVCGKEVLDNQGRGPLACYTAVREGVLRTSTVPEDTLAAIGNPTQEFIAAWK